MKSLNVFLTRTGLLVTNKEQAGFFTNSGKFIRPCPPSEQDYLLNTVGLTEITEWVLPVKNGYFFEHPELQYLMMNGGSPFPKWHFLKSIEVVCDESNYQWETSNNGGDYSYSTRKDYFAMKTIEGKWKFAYLTTHSTSAEFSYDELSGSFQNDLGNMYLENVEGNFRYSTQTRQSYDEQWCQTINEDEYKTVEQVATMSTFEEMWGEVYEYMPSKYSDDEKSEYPALSLSDKKEILTKLKSLGWVKSKLSRQKRDRMKISKGRRR